MQTGSVKQCDIWLVFYQEQQYRKVVLISKNVESYRLPSKNNRLIGVNDSDGCEYYFSKISNNNIKM